MFRKTPLEKSLDEILKRALEEYRKQFQQYTEESTA